ncbi:hypothetical protein AB0K88_24210 [Streptomyces werraensis]|uniref:hypothetical protein n=1 Tax=Streptomyces werraensis TaxID=68284 RepID=UPI0034227BB4
MTTRITAEVKRPRTLADLYEGRDLSPTQARRIVALLGLAQPRTPQHSKKAA